ncbi:hypothetical protein BDR03DRAFT_964346 [Suillus americanus]|nr:hypothetical protein BDR03DRAFT_964346 [Suillus americanus]
MWLSDYLAGVHFWSIPSIICLHRHHDLHSPRVELKPNLPKHHGHTIRCQSNKLISSAAAPPDPLPDRLPVSDFDQTSGFIRLSTARQVPKTLKFFYKEIATEVSEHCLRRCWRTDDMEHRIVILDTFAFFALRL